MMSIAVCTALIFLWNLLLNKYPSVLVHTSLYAYIPAQTRTYRYVLVCTTIWLYLPSTYEYVHIRTRTCRFEVSSKKVQTDIEPKTFCILSAEHTTTLWECRRQLRSVCIVVNNVYILLQVVQHNSDWLWTQWTAGHLAIAVKYLAAWLGSYRVGWFHVNLWACSHLKHSHFVEYIIVYVWRLKLQLIALQKAELEGQLSDTWLESHVSHHKEGKAFNPFLWSGWLCCGHFQLLDSSFPALFWFVLAGLSSHLFQ